MDKKLIERVGLLKEGMSEEEVLKIMGKPKEKEFINLKLARERGLPDSLIDKLRKPSLKILWYSYYVPVLVPPLFLRSEPIRTWVYVFLMIIEK